jgi:hypothetical protein
MNNLKDNSTIQCNIHQDSYAAMNLIKQKINHGRSIGIKSKYAEELLNKVVGLMDCSQYTDKNQNCYYCHMTAILHKKTSELIIKAKPLSL